ncbi:MAG: PadR family transcriptional regulator [Chloroflexi bacterium]|nr:PadR family transcriptional regulator [Chloroflexota bacterium]
MVEPCLLVLLQDGARHGYDLIAALVRFGLDPQLLDTGLVYRSLREMEEYGWLVSNWEMASSGPPRRVYVLTPAGKEALVLWREELRRTHEILHSLLDGKG